MKTPWGFKSPFLHVPCARPRVPPRPVGMLEFSRLAMIHGIGVDIVQLSRIGHAIDTYGERFLKRIYSPAEIQYLSLIHI